MLSEPALAKARLLGADRWVDELPTFLAELGDAWGFTLERALGDATEAGVFEVVRDGGTPAVLKLPIPRPEPYAEQEITVLRAAAGEGCPRLLRAETDLGAGRAAILMERLGPMMIDCGVPIDRRHELLVEAARRIWRPAAEVTDTDVGVLPDGRVKARRLIDSLSVSWSDLDRPCTEAAVDHAVGCGRRRAEAHDPDRAVLLHGDVHQWNALRTPDRATDGATDGGGFKLVDPDGLLAEPEYDLGVLMREDPVELLDGDPWERAERLAAITGTDPVAVWEWGVVERVATGLLATRIGLQPVGSEMLAAADRIAAIPR